MKIQKVIRIFNDMLSAGVVSRYAIGGAVGATFYLEPVATMDIDIFVGFSGAAGDLLVNPQPVFDFLKARGGIVDGEHIVVADWPVQVLPPHSPLVEEAMAHAVVRDVQGTPARVFTAEHLAAIALQTGRAKDKARLLQFIESNALDMAVFEAILQRHALAKPWQNFQKQFLTP